MFTDTTIRIGDRARAQYSELFDGCSATVVTDEGHREVTPPPHKAAEDEIAAVEAYVADPYAGMAEILEAYARGEDPFARQLADAPHVGHAAASQTVQA